MRLRHARLMLIAFIVFSSLLSGCTSPSSPSPPKPSSTDVLLSEEIALGSCALGLPEGTSDEEAIWALIAAESRYVVSQEIDKLMGLWAQDARITDMGHTPEQVEDDQSWRGADVIRHRYLRIVFPSAPDSAQSSQMDVQLDGQPANRAIVTATTQIGEELSVAGDRWQVVRMDGCWLIESLEFNRESKDEDKLEDKSKDEEKLKALFSFFPSFPSYRRNAGGTLLIGPVGMFNESFNKLSRDI